MLLTAVCSFSPFVFVTQCSTARFEEFAYVGKYKKASVGGTHSALRRLVTPGEAVGGFSSLSGGQQIFPLKGQKVSILSFNCSILVTARENSHRQYNR